MNSNTNKIIVLTFFAYWSLAGTKLLEVPKDLLHAIHMVESSGQIVDVQDGDNGLAKGPFQIHYAYWKDSGIPGKWEDCKDYNYSVKVVNGYMNRYCKEAIINNDYEIIARIHNGGANGAKKKSTIKYWRKIRKYLYGS